MLGHRILSAAFLIMALTAIVMASRGWMTIFVPTAVSLMAVVGLLEFYHLMEQRGFQPLRRWGVCFSVAYIFIIYFVSLKTIPPFEEAALMPVYVAIISAAVIIVFRANISTALSTLASTLAGFLYVTWLIAFCLRIVLWRGAEKMDGRWFFLFFIATVKVSDTAAYFIGTWLGRHKLAPSISPKKTIEGSIAGAVASMATGAVLAVCLPVVSGVFHDCGEFIIDGAGRWLAALLGAVAGLLLGVLGQIGDLAESLWKRDAAVKDSGGYIPGMGGVLDVVDSLLFTAPLMYLFMKFFDWLQQMIHA
ncbi:phosphatidate cytidylyltransferase [bacterium]|nr:phosphatidate cytidylyltransferase [bacterium]